MGFVIFQFKFPNKNLDMNDDKVVFLPLLPH